MTWLLDTVPYSHLTASDVPGPWPYMQPFYLLLNLAVGGAWQGSGADLPTLPASPEVDWVRVWQLPQRPGP